MKTPLDFFLYCANMTMNAYIRNMHMAMALLLPPSEYTFTYIIENTEDENDQPHINKDI